MLSVGPQTDVFAPDTIFAVPSRKPGSRGPAPSALGTDSEPQSIAELVCGPAGVAQVPVAGDDDDQAALVAVGEGFRDIVVGGDAVVLLLPAAPPTRVDGATIAGRGWR